MVLLLVQRNPPLYVFTHPVKHLCLRVSVCAYSKRACGITPPRRSPLLVLCRWVRLLKAGCQRLARAEDTLSSIYHSLCHPSIPLRPLFLSGSRVSHLHFSSSILLLPLTPHYPLISHCPSPSFHFRLFSVTLFSVHLFSIYVIRRSFASSTLIHLSILFPHYLCPAPSPSFSTSSVSVIWALFITSSANQRNTSLRHISHISNRSLLHPSFCVCVCVCWAEGNFLLCELLISICCH